MFSRIAEGYHYLTVRSLLTRLIRTLRIGSYGFRVQIGAVARPWYGYSLFCGALLAKKLSIKRISVLEYGVAGGAGLLNLEYHAKHIAKLLSIDIDIYGFDSGEGLPKPVDYRDIPYHWKEGFYKMDIDKLQSRLSTAKLVIGDIAKTSYSFFSEHNPAPIAAIMYDFDFYSSTAAALHMLDKDEKFFLPRIHCYFDDTIGNETILYNDFTGARLAINEFNSTHSDKKFGVPYHLLGRRVPEQWYHKLYILHSFKHSRYNDFVSEDNQQLRLS